MPHNIAPRRVAATLAELSGGNRLLRVFWRLAWLLLYRPSPRPFHFWRRGLLRLFGASIGRGAHPYAGAKIWAPWNLRMAEYSCIGDAVDCYCVAPIALGAHATVSQYSFLCTASHDYHDPAMPMISAPIVIEDEAWVAADVFVGPGVTIGRGAVVGARSAVLSNVPSWVVAAGSPASVRGARAPFVRQ